MPKFSVEVKRKIAVRISFYYIMTAVFMLCGVLMVIGRLSVCRLLKLDCECIELPEPMLPFEVGGVLWWATEFREVVT